MNIFYIELQMNDLALVYLDILSNWNIFTYDSLSKNYQFPIKS